jgi:RNA polymerase sigma-70 factor (ECF subfamily)
LIESAGREAVVASADNQSCPDPGGRLDLSTAISQLSQEQRDVVHLFYGEDLSIEDIATILTVPAGTVKSRLHHARESLKHYLGD